MASLANTWKIISEKNRTICFVLCVSAPETAAGHSKCRVQSTHSAVKYNPDSL